MRKDLLYLSGNFFDTEIPKDKSFLLKYFKSDIQISCLKYYIAFEDLSMFVEHTGVFATDNYLQVLGHRIEKLISARNQAKKNMDLELLWKIETGKYKN